MSPRYAQTSPNTFRYANVRLGAVSLSIVALSCIGLAVSAQTPASKPTLESNSAPQTPTPTLEPGRPVERTLQASESHLYNVMMAADQYLEALIEQRGINVTLEVSDPNGRTIAHINKEKTKQGAESLTLIAEASGNY